MANPPAKFDMRDATPISSGPPAKFDMANAMPIVDIKSLTTNTINPKTGTGYGLYRMLPVSNQGFTRTEDEINVPFNNVEQALKSGYHLHPDEQSRYEKDKAHPDSGPSTWEKVGQFLQPTPVDTMPIPAAPGADVAQLKAAGRVVYSTPEFLRDLGDAFLHMGQSGNGHPDFLSMIDPSTVPEQLQKQFHEDMKSGDPKLAVDNLIGSLAGMGIVSAATHGATKVMSEIARATIGKPIESIRQGVRETVGVPENTERAVEKFGKESEAARNAQTEGTEKAATELKAARQKAAEKNLRDIREHEELRKKVAEKNKRVLEEEKKRTQAQHKLDSASKELDEKIDAAQKKAKADDDAAWKKWRDKVGNAQVDMKPVEDAIKAQEDKMDPNQVREFRDILKNAKKSGGSKDMMDKAAQEAFGVNYDAMNPEQKIVVDEDFAERGIDIGGGGGGADTPISRLHGWKTQLEDAVRSDHAGNVKYAIGQVLDAVRALEEQVSKDAGADDLLKKARELHGPYVDTFRNTQSTPGTMANYVRSRVTPGFTKDARLEDYLENLGKYDPSIPQLANHIDNLEQGLKSLPKEGPLREKLATPPPSPLPPGDTGSHPVLSAGKGPEPLPKAGGPVPFGEKKAVGTIPKIEPPEVPNIQEQNLKLIDTQLRKYGRIGSWVLRIVVGAAAEHMAHGNLSAFGGELLIGQAGVTLLTKALRSPSVLEWLAKPSAEDMKMIATLPPEDAAKMREVLGSLADEDVKRDPKLGTIKIAPIMAAFLAGEKKQKNESVQDLKKQAEQLKPPSPSSGPQSSLTPPQITHIYNEITGQIDAV